MTSALKVAGESNLPGFFAVTVSTSIIFCSFSLNWIDCQMTSWPRTGNFFLNSKLPVWFECECNWIRLVFSVPRDRSNSATNTSCSPRCLAVRGLKVYGLSKNVFFFFFFWLWMDDATCIERFTAAEGSSLCYLESQNRLLGSKTTDGSRSEVLRLLKLKWTETQLHKVNMKMYLKVTPNSHLSVVMF